MVAEYGARLVSLYRFDHVTGLWHHRDGTVEPPLRLDQLLYDETGALTWPRRDDTVDEGALAGYLAEAEALFAALPDAASDTHVADSVSPDVRAALGDDFEHLRWFDLPVESLR